MKDAFWLIRHQWSRIKLGFLFSVSFYATYGALTGMFTNDWFLEMKSFSGFLVDMVVITFMSMNGFVFSKGYMNNPYWKNDSFTKQLAMMRSLPIPVDTLAKSRSIQLLVVSPISTLVFFFPFYFVSEWARELPLGTFLLLVLVWFAFGNISSAVFVIIEWSRSGKQYLINSCIAVLMFIAVAAAAEPLTGYHIVFGIGSALQQPNGWIITVIALAAGAAAHIGMIRKLRTLLLRRDFT